MGDTLQPVHILCNQDAVMRLAAADLRVGMSANNEVYPGEESRRLHVGLVAVVREEDDHIVLLAQPLVFGHRLVDGREPDSLAVVRMGVG